MIRRIFLSISVLLIAIYLALAVTAFNVKPAGQICEGIELVIKDSVNAGFVTQKEISAILKKKELDPNGKPLSEVRAEKIEENLAQHPLIDKVECYKTPGGKLRVEVTQRIPILRVMSASGGNYYIDNKGNAMPPETGCVAHLAIATGNVEKTFAVNELYKFAVFLQRNKFWNAQIEQINVLPNKEIELVPRVGDHIIFLGRLEQYEEKLDRLKEFYRKGLNKVGWDKYERINVEYGNQVICTKRKK